jgi:hypothetical protein
LLALPLRTNDSSHYLVRQSTNGWARGTGPEVRGNQKECFSLLWLFLFMGLRDEPS